jgi:hypothetical protein
MKIASLLAPIAVALGFLPAAVAVDVPPEKPNIASILAPIVSSRSCTRPQFHIASITTLLRSSRLLKIE